MTELPPYTEDIAFRFVFEHKLEACCELSVGENVIKIGPFGHGTRAFTNLARFGCALALGSIRECCAFEGFGKGDAWRLVGQYETGRFVFRALRVEDAWIDQDGELDKILIECTTSAVSVAQAVLKALQSIDELEFLEIYRDHYPGRGVAALTAALSTEDTAPPIDKAHTVHAADLRSSRQS